MDEQYLYGLAGNLVMECPKCGGWHLRDPMQVKFAKQYCVYCKDGPYELLPVMKNNQTPEGLSDIYDASRGSNNIPTLRMFAHTVEFKPMHKWDICTDQFFYIGTVEYRLFYIATHLHGQDEQEQGERVWEYGFTDQYKEDNSII
jgi:hypothetical protein